MRNISASAFVLRMQYPVLSCLYQLADMLYLLKLTLLYPLQEFLSFFLRSKYQVPVLAVSFYLILHKNPVFHIIYQETLSPYPNPLKVP